MDYFSALMVNSLVPQHQYKFLATVPIAINGPSEKVPISTDPKSSFFVLQHLLYIGIPQEEKSFLEIF